MKRFMLCNVGLIVLLMVVGMSVSACSSKQSPTIVTPNISVDESTKGSDLKLPDSYPNEVVPIYPNSHLYSVLVYEQSYTILFYSKDDVSKVISYYKNAFKDAKNKMESLESNSYTVFGELDGYTITFDCGEDDELEGYQTLVTLNVMKNP
jgi:hypothetical protein